MTDAESTGRDAAAPYFEANRARWNEVVPIHAASQGYDLEGFLAGRECLERVEIEEMGDVAGRTLLHLQCHFGMDTLGWARRGARVTGVDFSGAAIEQARDVARRAGIADARFVRANVYDAPAVLDQTFDIVYTGIGALCWLPDIRAWAQVVARFLKPGGFVYLYEGHPVLWSLDDEREDGALVIRYPYFEPSEPLSFSSPTTYVDGPPLANTQTYEWNHGLGEIVTALIEAGLRLDFLHEHREVVWKALPWMVGAEGADPDRRYTNQAGWRLPPGQQSLCPLMYSLKATRPA